MLAVIYIGQIQIHKDDDDFSVIKGGQWDFWSYCRKAFPYALITHAKKD